MKTNSLKISSIAKSPAVLVKLTEQEGLISQIRLELAKDFSYQIIGNFSDLLEEKIVHWLSLYSQKKQNKKELPLQRKKQTIFQKNVSDTLASIPFGSLTSYKKLAESSGYPNAQRAVGNVCSQNNFLLLIPCHRVIRSEGIVGGFAIDINIKKRLLQFETGKAF